MAAAEIMDSKYEHALRYEASAAVLINMIKKEKI